MKKLIITGAACSAMALSGYAQGFINFQNAITTQFYFNSTAATANKVSSASIESQAAALPLQYTSTGVVDVGLFWSTAAFTDSAQATLAETVTMSATAGTLAGTASLGLTGTAPNQQVYVQVFAWDSTYATPDAALAAGAYFGASSAGQTPAVYGTIGAAQLVTLGAGAPAPAGVVFGTSAPFFPRTVLLQNTPEPATIALGGLGAAALLLFRRRK
jgi:PEP-CTERM motif